ncbi:MAG: hypothetical protein PWR13_525 [Archaeoglobi archaeon]|nr:hypothetical protein [Archaeoglobi archaeon]
MRNFLPAKEFNQFEMKVSVIISTYTQERFEDVLKCLKHIKKQTRKPDEVILVLDPKEDLYEFYYERLGDENIMIISADDSGLSNARNAGVKASSGEIIAFIDDDAYPDPHWLENMLKNFEDERVWVVGGRVIPEFEKGRPKWFPEELDWIVGCTYKGMPVKNGEIRNPIGANMALRKRVFEKIGYFHTKIGRKGKILVGSEETELCMRLKLKKPDVKVVYDQNAVVYHRVPEERLKLKYVLRRAYYEGISKSMLSREYEISTEKSYALSLIKAGIRYLRRFELAKIFVLAIVFVSTLLGYVVGHIKSYREALELY